MTEKHYGGAAGFGAKDKPNQKSNISSPAQSKQPKNKSSSDNKSQTSANSRTEEVENYILAGKIASQVKEYAKSFIKPGMPLLEIAEKIESKILELKGSPAFPVNLSKNEIAAHATPSYNDTETASGLLKVDLGVQIEGCIADTSLTLDLENTEENKLLIKAAESALNAACEKINLGISLSELGKVIESTAYSTGVQTIHNLSGHSLDKNIIHAGITIPNYDNSSPQTIPEGFYAIEPFTTLGVGAVRDGKPSGIYHLQGDGSVRDSFAREVAIFISEEYETRPFCSRWLVKKFGTRALLALKRLEDAKVLYQYPQLIEKSGHKVAQAEHTIILTEKEKIISTK